MPPPRAVSQRLSNLGGAGYPSYPSLYRCIAPLDPHLLLVDVLRMHPEYRHVIRRAQTVRAYPYGEIRDNLIGSECHPINLLRCKLAFFGASKFDPKSDRWTRITLYQGAPLPDELDEARENADDRKA